MNDENEGRFPVVGTLEKGDGSANPGHPPGVLEKFGDTRVCVRVRRAFRSSDVYRILIIIKYVD